MHIRHAQRKHIIQSFNSLLYQLHTISFLLSPRLWPFIVRMSTQFQFTRPRDVDSQRSLRFWFIVVVVINLQSLFYHIFSGPSENRSIVLDFVGIGHKPSKTLVLSLDVAIIFLEFILATVSYETSLSLAMPPDTPDPLQAQPIPAITPATPFPLDGPSSKPFEPAPMVPEYILDLRLRTLLQRLRHPPPPPPPGETDLSDELLPLPNTTPFQLSRSLNMLVRARAQLRERAARVGEATRQAQPNDARGEQRLEESRRIPGGMDEHQDT
ncbi:uncharacterized protein BXZ73DRAFT_90387 [Epithele typhae]|uniref:uncharacterized protein n=1 Tax=Epithele typhae TaxID=378194 RepID=UPI0020076F44|nr:uncharacterized protein BXZ73DRAFT_90387 [Epithele typhae]KAH9929532.1 hypothetical protein BXZ73DRAFT_90387 [Epithele typhae]